MSEKQVTLTPPPTYEGERPTQASLLERRDTLRSRHRETLERVNNLVRSQHEISQELGEELAAMQSNGQRLDELSEAENNNGMLAAGSPGATAYTPPLAGPAMFAAPNTFQAATSVPPQPGVPGGSWGGGPLGGSSQV